MFLHVQTSWPCYQRLAGILCDGTLKVLAENNGHSLSCPKCGFGTSGIGPLPDFVMGKLFDEGYIRQLTRRPAERQDLVEFFIKRLETRSVQEITDDILENFEVFTKHE